MAIGSSNTFGCLCVGPPGNCPCMQPIGPGRWEAPVEPNSEIVQKLEDAVKRWNEGRVCGWVCPKCNHGKAPNVTTCDCADRPKVVDVDYDNGTITID